MMDPAPQFDGELYELLENTTEDFFGATTGALRQAFCSALKNVRFSAFSALRFVSGNPLRMSIQPQVDNHRWNCL